MNEKVCKLVKEMAKFGARHATIAQSLGLSTLVLRKYYARELLAAATEAELDADPARRKPAPAKPTETRLDPSTIPPFEVHINDGEPNYPC